MAVNIMITNNLEKPKILSNFFLNSCGMLITKLKLRGEKFYKQLTSWFISLSNHYYSFIFTTLFTKEHSVSK